MRRRGLFLVVMAVGLVACGLSSDPSTGSAPTPAATTAPTAPATTALSGMPAEPDATPLGPLLDVMAAGAWRSTGEDTFEVWICHVPADTTASIYGGLPLRLPLTPTGVAATLAAHVTPYFEALSNGRYRPVFIAGGEVTMAAADEPQACVDRAIEGAGPTTRAVLAVADAEHAPEQKGGFGNGGGACPALPPCPVAGSRRSAYVGASDFDHDWGNAPPMDLVEHEIGHTLGWVHSGIDSDGRYLSALDVMSNSAAPRDTHPDRRDGPDTLGVNRLLAGWLPPDDVWVASPGGGTGQLVASSGVTGQRLAVVPLGGGRFLTVELLVASGFDAHLPADGIAVHRVTVTNGVVQPIEPLVGAPPYTALLRPGASLDTDGWRITVGDGWTVTITPLG